MTIEPRVSSAPATPPLLALVLAGGGARGAYQVGVLKCLARHYPDLLFPIITGVSAGGINAATLAASRLDLGSTVEILDELWGRLTADQVFRSSGLSLAPNLFRWFARLITGNAGRVISQRGLVDTAPLRRLLEGHLAGTEGAIPGIDENLAEGRLRALALTALDYSTGQTVTWVQGENVEPWRRPNRKSVAARIGVEHVMASAALPLFFPAVQVGPHWFGDGGIRLAAPLSPALHLGAERILVVSTRYARSQEEAETPNVEGYPPPAQVLGLLLNAVFLDVLDQDAERLESLNRLIQLGEGSLGSEYRSVKAVVLRPSEDLGRLAREYEFRLPKAFRYLTRGLGTRATSSADFLSLLMFQPDYLKRLIDIGERDAESQRHEIAELLTGP